MVDLKYPLKMKNIIRLPAMHKHRSYNLAEHSFYVVILFQYFAKKEGINYDLRVLDLVLKHDLVETITTDLPYPLKNFSKITQKAWETIENEVLRDFPEMKKYSDASLKEGMTEEQFKLFKACDMLELYIFCREEIKLGNTASSLVNVEKTALTILREDLNFNSIIDYIEENK